MRIPSTKIWLAYALTLGIGCVKGADDPVLVFNNQSFEDFRSYQDTSVLVLSTLGRNFEGSPTSPTFTWRTNDETVQIEKVNLYNFNEDTKDKGEPIGEKTAVRQKKGKRAGNDSDLETPAAFDSILSSQPTTTNTGREHVLPTTISFPASHGKPKIGLDVSWEPTRGFVTIENVTQLETYLKSPLFFGVQWVDKTGNSGETYSGAFAVVNSDNDASDITQDPNSLYRNYFTPVLQESGPSKPKPTYMANPNSETPGAGAPATGKSSGEESPGRLATGAIIGIAVACGILGLLLILGAIWFLIRRRNKQAGNTNYGSPGRPYGTERSRTDDLIAEKEASAGGADPSPHSPYSDDGVVLVPSAGHTSTYHNGGSNGAIAMGTPVAAPILPQQIPQRSQPHDHHHQQVGPYATYSERGSIGALGGGGGSPSTRAASITHSTHDETSRAGMGSPTAGRATPHSSLAPQYAHLVEEGMTEDEIRRLEDEERQLDAEIERAGRR